VITFARPSSSLQERNDKAVKKRGRKDGTDNRQTLFNTSVPLELRTQEKALVNLEEAFIIHRTLD
jgi:hypothetical protein